MKIHPIGCIFILCRGPGSNRRPHPLQGYALPTELPRQAKANGKTGFHIMPERRRGKLCLPWQHQNNGMTEFSHTRAPPRKALLTSRKLGLVEKTAITSPILTDFPIFINLETL